MWKWTRKREIAALSLANGETWLEAAEKAGVSDRTIGNWLNVPEFAEEVDRLTFMTDVANRAHRLRLAKRVIRDIGIQTEKDLLDWLKYIQSETDGVSLDLTELIASFTQDGE